MYLCADEHHYSMLYNSGMENGSRVNEPYFTGETMHYCEFNHISECRFEFAVNVETKADGC